MKLGLINSAFYQAGVPTATGLKHIARIGFDCVDIATEAVGISKSSKGMTRCRPFSKSSNFDLTF